MEMVARGLPQALAVAADPARSDGLDEEALGRRLLTGDRSAAEQLVELTYQRIHVALRKLCGGDDDLARDLTQETYRKAWASLGSFRADCRFSTWLYRIAYNTFLSHLRRPRAVALDDVPPPLVPGPDAEERAAASESKRRLRRAVLELPEPLRFAVTARYWAGLSSPEIARLEGVTPVGARKRLLRALSQLESSLSPEVSR
jgi:RNA polymerase sigma-70 factor, ECF subfamily